EQGPVPLAGGWHVQVRPHDDRRAMQHRRRRLRPLRREDGRRGRARGRLIPDERGGRSPEVPVGRESGEGAMNGFAAFQRWTTTPGSGVAGERLMIPDALAAALRHFAATEGVPLHTLLLLAHARVLSLFSGENEV